MQKLKSYLGLALAALLGWIFLSPQKPSSQHEPMHVTPLDRTAISLIIQLRNPSFGLLGQVEGYMRHCPDGPETQIYGSRRADCDIRNAAPDLTQMIDMESQFQRLDPDFYKALDNYFDGRRRDDVRDKALHDLDMRKKWSDLERRAIATYPTLLKELRGNYIGFVYVAHALFVMLLLTIVHYRRKVGTALLWPFTRALSLLGKAHEKI